MKTTLKGTLYSEYELIKYPNFRKEDYNITSNNNIFIESKKYQDLQLFYTIEGTTSLGERFMKYGKDENGRFILISLNLILKNYNKTQQFTWLNLNQLEEYDYDEYPTFENIKVKVYIKKIGDVFVYSNVIPLIENHRIYKYVYIFKSESDYEVSHERSWTKDGYIKKEIKTYYKIDRVIHKLDVVELLKESIPYVFKLNGIQPLTKKEIEKNINIKPY